MKKTNRFTERICITASPQNSANRAPVSFTAHRGVLWVAAAVITLVIAFCIFTAVKAANTVGDLNIRIDTLRQTLDAQNSEMAQYEQRLDELQQTQQSP